MDWKTRLEWSPEEVESFERERQAETARRKAVKPREAAAPAKAPAKAAAPADAEVKHPAPVAPQEAKPAAPVPSPPAAKPPVAVPPEPKKPADSVEPPPVPPVGPAAAAAAKPVPPAPPPTSPKEAIAASEKAGSPAGPVSPAPAKAATPRPERSAPLPAPPSAPDASRITDLGEVTRALPSDAISKPHVHFEGNLEGKDLIFSLVLGDHVVGRVPEVPVHLDGTEISRRHAVIRVGLTEVSVEDLGSRNGTFVNRERITAPRSLKDGDVVHFGDVPLRVRFPADRSGQRPS